MKIGFIGLGIMGSRMAGNLQKHGHSLVMPLTNVAKEIYRFAIREGHGSADFSAIYEYLAQHHNGESGNPA